MNRPEVLNVENLSVDILRSGQRNPVLRNINLTVYRRETHVLIGASGSGKTTLAMIISGIIPRDLYEVVSGHVWFCNEAGKVDLLTLDWTTRQQVTGQRINMIFQEPATAFNPVRKVGRQLLEAPQQAVDEEMLQSRARSLGLDPAALWDRYPWQLSGGQQQRFLLARALATTPDLILADEPTSALDHHHQQEFLRDLSKAVSAEQGPGLLLISHDRDLVSQIADTITEIEEGRVIHQGPPDENRMTVAKSEHLGRGGSHDPSIKPEAPRELLKIRNLSAGYEEDVPVLHELHLNLYSGELVGIAGSSGSGKSSLLRAILGLMPWQSSVEEEKRSPDARPAHIQLVYQDPGRSLNPVMSLSQTMREWARAAHPDAIRSLSGLLREVGLDEGMLDRLPHMFSGGQRQRMAIARALLTQPEVLLADEPFSNLDANLRDQVMQIFLDLTRQKNMGVLVVAHDLPRLERFCDRILLLKEGRIMWEGTPDQLSEQQEDWIRELRGEHAH